MLSNLTPWLVLVHFRVSMYYFVYSFSLNSWIRWFEKKNNEKSQNFVEFFFIQEIFSTSLQRKFWEYEDEFRKSWNTNMSSENLGIRRWVPRTLSIYVLCKHRWVYKTHNWLNLNVNKKYTHHFQLFEIQF